MNPEFRRELTVSGQRNLEEVSIIGALLIQMCKSLITISSLSSPHTQLLAGRPPEERGLELDLLKAIFDYTPSKRPHAIEALSHPFFDELRQPGTTMPPNGTPLPELFDFTPEGELERIRGIFKSVIALT